MSKKGIIILSSVVGLVAVGAALSALIDWPVDTSQASGDIAKSSRFSRKTSEETLTNMEELLLNDKAYKESVVAANFVMQTRAQQFETLVSLSNEAAGGIEAFADVLKDMNAARQMIANVGASLAEAGSDLNAALGGAQRPDLAQNTINASLAYTTLQKQNKLADRFIATADAYLKDAAGSDQLKFVRDQWVDYQRMSAALDGDAQKAAQLEEKGYQLSGEQSLAALNELPALNKLVVIMGAGLSHSMDVGNEISGALPANVVGQVFTVLCEAAEMTVEQTGIESMNREVMMSSFEQIVGQGLSDLVQGGNLAGMETGGKLGELQTGNGLADLSAADNLAKTIRIAREEVFNASQPTGSLASGPDASGFQGGGAVATLNMLELGASPLVVTNFDQVVTTIKNGEVAGQMGNLPSLSREIGQIISFTAVGKLPTLEGRL